MTGPYGLLIRDHVRSDATRLAERFIEHVIEPHMGGLKKITIYLVLKHSRMRRGSVTTKVRIPEKPKDGRPARPWMEVRVLLRGDLVYPVVQQFPTASVRVTDPTARALMGIAWFYEHEDVTFADDAEAFVFGVGRGMFKILRRRGLVPGRASRVGMNRNGLEWLQKFREWEQSQKGDPRAEAQ